MDFKPCIFNNKDMVIQQEQVEMKGSALPLMCWNKNKQFFSINPVRDIGESRRNENVMIMKNFLFESDSLTLEEQKPLVKKYKDIISMATFSGNKSIHFIIQVLDTPDTLDEYHYVWELLKNKYFPYADRACNDCIRLSRTPEALRDNNKKQVLIWNTLQPLELNWKPLYLKQKEIKNMSNEYRKTIPITRNESLTYEAECILNGDYPKGERDEIIRKGLPYLYYNRYALDEILENNMSIRSNPQTIKNYYLKLENNYYS